MARHARRRRGRIKEKHLITAMLCVLAVAAGGTTALAATGGLIATSEVSADGGKYVTTVEDGKLTRLEFVPDASPSATVTTPAPPLTTPVPAATTSTPASATTPAATVTPTGKPPRQSDETTSTAPSASQGASGTPAPSTSTSAPAASTAPPAVANGDWLSGLSGSGDTDGSFGTWRGTPVEIVGTWADADVRNQTRVFTVTGGSGTYAGPIDIGVGALVQGETWAQAARGAYDARWRESLTVMRDARAGKGTTYIRFAHEMNGNWYPWAVNASNRADFITAWGRYRALQREIFPAAKLVFSVNRESVGNGVDWRTTVPPASQIDVMGVDYYDQNPAATTQAAWDVAVTAVDGRGAPKGLEAHRLFAKSLGLPLSVNEWGDKREQGDGTVYIDNMHRFFAANAGSGPGQLLYEVYFNVPGYDGNYQIYPSTQIPQAAARYREVF